jgi:hypothetical protein
METAGYDVQQLAGCTLIFTEEFFDGESYLAVVLGADYVQGFEGLRIRVFPSAQTKHAVPAVQAKTDGDFDEFVLFPRERLLGRTLETNSSIPVYVYRPERSGTETWGFYGRIEEPVSSRSSRAYVLKDLIHEPLALAEAWCATAPDQVLKGWIATPPDAPPLKEESDKWCGLLIGTLVAVPLLWFLIRAIAAAL